MKEISPMNIGRYVAIAAMASGLVAVLSGCPRHEGPGEQAGKAVDRAVDKTGQEMEKAGNNLRDAAKGDKK
jgi:hypothetical protein